MNLRVRKPKYFDGKVSHGFVALFTSKAITNVANGLFGIFLPIYLFIVFDYSIFYVLSYYLLGKIFYIVFVGYGVRFLNKFGFRKSLQVSTFIGALYYLELYFLNTETALFMIPILIVTISVWRMLYWIPYHVDFAKFSNKKNRGKEVGLIESTLSVIGVVAPIAAGFIIGNFGYNVLFVLGVVIYITSLIPFLTIPETREKFSWSYPQIWKELFAKKNRKEVVAFFADGAESAVGVVIWPIFIFQLLNGDYFKIGAISALVVAVTVILQLLVGKYTDKQAKEKIIKYGSVLYSLVWIIKVFIVTALHIFLVDALHKLTKIFLRIPFDAMTYDIAADHGHYVDEFTVLHEIAINLGRSFMYVVVMILTIFISINWVFVLAAVASIALNVLYYKKSVVKKQRK